MVERGSVHRPNRGDETMAPTPDHRVLEALPGFHSWTVVARGAQAEVWTAVHPLLARRVAVKALFDPLDDESEERFRAECTALAHLSGHDHVITVHDARLTTDHRAVLIMELAVGGSLADMIARDGPVPAGRLLRIGRELTGALAAAHDLGILHLDVKPANVLLDEQGRTRLADFGIARIDRLRRRGSSHRTPAFAAPEVLRGDPATDRTDVYGVGATLCTLALGRPPFRLSSGDAPQEIEERTLAAATPDLRTIGLPPALAELIQAAMAKDPQDRPSMRRLRTRMLEVEAGARPARVEEPDPSEVTEDRRARPRRRRDPDRTSRPVAVVVVGAAGTLLLGGSLLGRGSGGSTEADRLELAADCARTAQHDVMADPTATPAGFETIAALDDGGRRVRRDGDAAVGEVTLLLGGSDPVTTAGQVLVHAAAGDAVRRSTSTCTTEHGGVHTTVVAARATVIVVRSRDRTFGQEYIDAVIG